jgi:hypothetical protein
MKEVVSIDDFIQDVALEPCLLHKVDIELLKFHGGIVWVMGADTSVRVLGAAMKTMRVLGDKYADNKPLSSQ